MMMNLNLKKINLLIFLILTFIIQSKAQVNSKSKFNFYTTFGAVFNGSFNSSSSSNVLSNGQTIMQYQDSISDKETWRLTFNPQVGIIYQLSRKSDLQFGLSYIVLGHQRQLNDIKYNESTYPGIGGPTGIIQENTNVERNINLNYRYQYLQIPVIYNYHLNTRAIASKIKISLSTGIGCNILLKHDINAVLGTGFKIDEKSSFSLDSTGFKGSAVTANLMLGTRLDYNFSKQLKIIAQPMLGYFPLSVSNSQIEAKPWFLNLSFGIIYALDNIKK